MTCPACGATAPAGSRFCSSCGRGLLPAGDERRVVTVVFGDLVGFTALSETLDPEQVKNLVDRCFERLAADITTFGGQVDKIIGDAIVALFGAPVAHEDDAERAVRAALRMQQTLANFGAEAAGRGVRMRIGVNTGEVLVGALRAGGDYTAMGDVVNTASRLQATADPGEVLVGPATYAATAAVIRYRPRGSLSARGRDEAVEGWTAVEPILPPGYRPRRIDVPLVGRDSELILLRQAVTRSVSNRRAQLTLLLGDAGMGKTRLAEEVGEWARCSEGAVVLEGRCVPYGEANVWWPVAEALRQGCGVELGATLEVARAGALEQVAAAYELPTTSAEVVRVANGLLTLMGYEGSRQVDPASLREEGVRSLVAFIEASTRRVPVVILLSDLHWADELVLELIDSLFERLHRHPLLLLATSRPSLTERWAPRPGRHDVLVLNLDPLDRGASADLLESLLGDEPSPELAGALIDRSGGNPFFLEELVSLLGEQPTAAESLGISAKAVADARVSTLPDTLRGLVAARLDALTPEERAVVQDAAVLGRRAPLSALQEMSSQLRHTTDIDGVVASLIEKDILVTDGHMWSFRSDLVREVAYNTITKFDRAKRHAGIATYIESVLPADGSRSDDSVDRLSHHYGVAAELAGELGALDQFGVDLSDRAVEWIERAARRAAEGEVLPLANKLFTQALGLAGTEPSARRLRLLLGRASARTEAWELSSARADVVAAAAEADQLGDRHCQAWALLVLGQIDQKAGNSANAVATLGRAALRFAELGDEDGRAEALRQIGMTELFRGRFVEAERSVTDALEAFRALDQARGEAWALQNLAWIAFLTGRVTEAERWLQDSVATFSEIGDPSGMAWALGLLAFVRFQQGRADEAETIGTQILQEARGRGDRWATGMMLVLLSSIRLWSGRTQEAVELADEARAAFSTIGDRLGLTQAGALLARALIMSGRVDEGFLMLTDAVDDDRDGHARPGETLAQTAAITCAVQVGEPERFVRGDLRHQFDDADGRRLDDAPGDPDRLVAIAIGALQQGNAAAALAQLERVAARVAETGVHPYAMAGRALACAATGRATEAVELAETLISLDQGTYLDRVLAGIGAGLAEASAGHGAAAARWLSDARATADATGDRLAQAVVRVAEAVALQHLGDPHASEAQASARARLDAIGLVAAGWSAAFGLMVDHDTGPASLGPPLSQSAGG